MGNRVAHVARVVLLGLLIAALLAPAALAASVSAVINAQTKVYEYPTKAARAIHVPQYLGVKLTGVSHGWARVSYKGNTAYLPVKYVTLKKPIKAYTVQKAKAYRHVGGSSVGTLPAGTAVYVVGVNGSFALVQNKAGTVRCYVKSSALSRKKPSLSAAYAAITGGGTPPSTSAASAVPSALRSTTTSASESKVEYVIYLAQNLIGAPYAENANPPRTFDCAKFVHYIYGKCKSNCLKGSSKAQGYDDRYDMVVDMDDLKRGDLVFFDTVEDDDLCDHVGIYLGGGYFIHASSSGGKVILSNLSSGYYSRTFSWGRRIFNS